jgi:hypothetical protein
MIESRDMVRYFVSARRKDVMLIPAEQRHAGNLEKKAACDQQFL